jgi:hypothetical protein
MKKHKIVHELEDDTFYYMIASEENIRLYEASYLRYKNRIPPVGYRSRALESTYLWFFKKDNPSGFHPYNQLGATRKDKDYFLRRAFESFSLSKQVEISFEGVAMIDLSSYRRSSRIKKTRSRSQS